VKPGHSNVDTISRDAQSFDEGRDKFVELSGFIPLDGTGLIDDNHNIQDGIARTVGGRDNGGSCAHEVEEGEGSKNWGGATVCNDEAIDRDCVSTS